MTVGRIQDIQDSRAGRKPGFMKAQGQIPESLCETREPLLLCWSVWACMPITDKCPVFHLTRKKWETRPMHFPFQLQNKGLLTSPYLFFSFLSEKIWLVCFNEKLTSDQINCISRVYFLRLDGGMAGNLIHSLPTHLIIYVYNHTNHWIWLYMR